jgi:HlyD family secretion protein
MIRPLVCVLALALAGCEADAPVALGTLERDRITLPSPVSERIVELRVREGQRVAAGDVLMVLESARNQARVDASQAEVERLRQVLAEARSGPRLERIEETRQRLARARSVSANAERERERVEAVVARGLLPAAERDRARSASTAAAADVRAVQAQLAELQNGTRVEALAQAEAAVRAAEAALAATSVDLARTRIDAPRAGVVDSLPFEVGDQPAQGAPLAILLVGEHVHARVHVPQPLRLGLAIGTPATVYLQGDARPHPGKVRAIRNEASFTPYYALSGEDSAQLSYLAEVELEESGDALPLGLPVRVEFGAAALR